MKLYSQFLLLMSIGMLLAACSGNSPSQRSQSNFNFRVAEVIQTSPGHEATDVERDPAIELIFDEKLDAFSAFDFNFQLWTAQGEHIGGHKLVSANFVEHPEDPSRRVTKIRFELRDRPLHPGHYVFTWASPLSDEISDQLDIDPSLIGLVTVDGFPVAPGAIAFEVGREFSQVRGSGFQIESCSPGQILFRGLNFNFNGTLMTAFNPTSPQSTWFFGPSQDIQCDFNQPIARIDGVDPNVPDSELGEIPPTPLEDFPSMTVGVIDHKTEFGVLYSQAIELQLPQLHQLYGGRIDGKVFSINNRRTLVFRPDPGSGYPDNPAQKIMYFLKDLRSMGSNEILPDVITVGGFLHSSGASAEIAAFINDTARTLMDRFREGEEE